MTPTPSSSCEIRLANPSLLSRRGRRVSELGRAAGKGARPQLGICSGDVQRLGKQVGRIGAQLVAHARRRRVGGHDPCAALGADHDLAPTDSSREVGVFEADHRPAPVSLEDGLEAKRGEAAGTGPGADSRRDGLQLRRPPVELELEAARDLLREAGPASALAFLVRGNLGQVEDVLHVDAVAGSLDRAVAVDREVPERMRLRRCRNGERGEHADKERDAFHDAYLLATGLQRSEKCGFRRSARRNQSRADAWSPRQRSIIPRWKYFSASRVPSLSERRE